MHHRVKLQHRSEAVKNKPADLGLQDRKQIAELAQIVFCPMNVAVK
jgi:hypothetical protein